MAITKSAKKALRQSKRRKVGNDRRMSAMRSATKAVRMPGASKVETMAKAYQAIDKAMKSGLIKKNTAARKKARVARLLKDSK